MKHRRSKHPAHYTRTAPARTWDFSAPDPLDVLNLQRTLGLHPLTARILTSRGYTDPDTIQRFLYPSLEHLHDPMLMLHMKRAVRRTLEALRDDEKILVFGDDDVDGVTSASCAFLFLKHLGARVTCTIPLRTVYGGGLSCEAIQDIYDQGVRLLIATDCGGGAVEPIRLAQSLGLDVIIIDHHTLAEELPPAFAILNPLLPECPYPFKKLAAVGVSFNFISALHASLCDMGAFSSTSSTPPDLTEYLDIVALGTVADVVPLIDQNRLLVRLGLDVIKRRRRPGISALLERARVDDQIITARTIGYRIAPLINAAGRIGDATRCVSLFASTSYREAAQIARDLEKDNWERQRHEREVIDEAIEQAETELSAGRSLLMLSNTQWHQGVLGIIASRIKERYHRPAALAFIDEKTGMARVSMRSIQGIDLIRAMRNIEDLVESYGGHVAAAGMTLRADRLEEVRAILEASIREQSDPMPTPSIHIDAQCQLHDLNPAFADELALLAPFGAGNPEPVLLVQNARSVRNKVVNDRHLRLRLRQGETMRNAIGFALAPLSRILSKPIDLVLTPRLTILHNRTEIELMISDIRRHVRHNPGEEPLATETELQTDPPQDPKRPTPSP